MVYYQHDISDVLSNKIPAQLLPKFKDDLYNELVFTSPALLSPEFKTFYRDLYYAALEL